MSVAAWSISASASSAPGLMSGCSVTVVSPLYVVVRRMGVTVCSDLVTVNGGEAAPRGVLGGTARGAGRGGPAGRWGIGRADDEQYRACGRGEVPLLQGRAVGSAVWGNRS